MTFDEYQVAAMKTDGLLGYSESERLKYAMGAIGGEAGEIVDYLKKVCYHNKPMDRIKIIEECGDLLWGIAHLLTTINARLSTTADINIDKLEARYPDGYSDAHANAPRGGK